MTKPILYTYYRSSASWRVRLVLAYKGIETEFRYVNLVKDGGQQYSEDYAKLNPFKQVPTFIHDDFIISQSLPIMEYLDEIFPQKPILPKDPKKKAQARQMCEMINSGIQPLVNLPVLNEAARLSGNDQTKIDWAKHWIDRGFVAFEKMLAKTSGKYCVGNDISMVDMCLIPQIHNANRNGVDMSKFPLITKISEECQKLEAFKKADWKNQDDCPEEFKK